MLDPTPTRQRVHQLKALVEQLQKDLDELARIREVNVELHALLARPERVERDVLRMDEPSRADGSVLLSSS